MSDNIKDALASALRNKIGPSALRSIFTRERVNAGQQVIDTAKEKYFDNIEQFITTYQAAINGDIDPKQIYEVTKSLKAQTEGLGFAFLMDLSDALYKFLQERVDAYSATKTTFTKEERLVVQKYSEAIFTAIEKRERGKGGMVEQGILSSLDLLKKRLSKPKN